MQILRRSEARRDRQIAYLVQTVVSVPSSAYLSHAHRSRRQVKGRGALAASIKEFVETLLLPWHRRESGNPRTLRS